MLVSDAATATGAPLAAALDLLDWLRALQAIDLVFASTSRSTARPGLEVPAWSNYLPFT